MTNTSIYEDISRRADGNIYIGVVGPVRTGKSTFIRRFMDVMVFPHMADPFEKSRVMDELPQSGEGKTITTTEPKFIPPKAVRIETENGAGFGVRLVDCVGYLVPGVLGCEEDGKERLVDTPWSKAPMPFSQAAELGTEKVITDHAVVGIVVTTDGSFGDLSRKAFVSAEEKTIAQLRSLGKPFVVLLNSAAPEGQNARALEAELEEKYGVPVLAVNCQRLTEAEFDGIFQKLVYQFPVQEVDFKLPGYLDALPMSHWIKDSIASSVKEWLGRFDTMGEVIETCGMIADGTVIRDVKLVRADMAEGLVALEPVLDQGLYYKVVEELMGATVENDGQLFRLLKEYAAAKRAYDSIEGALNQANATNYGIVAPRLSEMELEKPQVFKQGSKYGVRMTAKAPCLHIIRTNISTEVSPVVGSESQSEDLARHLQEQFDSDEGDIWETNLFGKSLKEMVTEQMESKLKNMPQPLQGKVQRSLQRISDEGKDYFICIIL